MNLRLTASLLVSVLAISSIPAEAVMAKEVAEDSEYITVGAQYFSAGAHLAISETVVMNDEDDSILVDSDTDVTENDAPIVAEPEVEEPVADDNVAEAPETTPEVEVPVSPYANMAIANNINSYLNVRKEPKSDAAVLGKLYKNNAAIVLENQGEWLKVTSGNVTGYIYAKYVTVGDEELCKSVAKMTAKITTNSLRLRKKATTDSGVHTLLGKGQKVTVLDDSLEGWLKVKYKSYTGYISAEYADVTVSHAYGETKEEEAARIAKEQATAAQKEEANKKEEASNDKVYKEPTSSSAQALVDYALQFVGNRYKWGGTSLTNGVDCSGFVMKVYEKFGYDLPHSSYKLRSVGRKVSASQMQPGDIICYSGHVAIYIGDGKIVHAANKKKGIIITNKYNYKKVVAIRRVLP